MRLMQARRSGEKFAYSMQAMYSIWSSAVQRRAVAVARLFSRASKRLCTPVKLSPLLVDWLKVATIPIRPMPISAARMETAQLSARELITAPPQS